MRESIHPSTLSHPQLALLHLSQFGPLSPTTTAPRAQTQEGISAGLSRSIPVISRACKELLDREEIEAATRHVEGHTRRRRCYWLTQRGQARVGHLKKDLLEAPVEVQTLDGSIRVCKLGQVNEVLGVRLPLLNLVFMISSDRPLTAARTPRLQTRFMPSVLDRFMGRRDEVERLSNWLIDGSGSVFALLGMAGIGKSSLARLAFETAHEGRAALWFTITRWDTPESFLRGIAGLLAAIGRPQLEVHLSSGGDEESGSLHRALEIVTSDFTGIPRPVVVLDDIHLIPPPLAHFLTDLIRYSDPTAGPRWLLCGRDRSTIGALEGQISMVTLNLEGLRSDEVQNMLPSASTDQVQDMMTNTGGHPLAIRLYTEMRGPRGQEAVESYIQRQILTDLSDAERRVAEIASLNILPSQPRDLLVEKGLRKDSIQSLIDRGLLVKDEEGELVLHDLIRQPIATTLPDHELTQLHDTLHKHHRKSEHDDALLRTIHHLSASGKAEKAEQLVERWGHGLIDRGRTELYHVLEPLPRTSMSGILRARTRLQWGDPDTAARELNDVGSPETLAKPLALEWLTLKARISRSQGNRDEVLQVHKQLIGIERKGRESWATAEAHNELGMAARSQNDTDSARHHYGQARDIFERIEKAGRAPPRRAGSIKVLSNIAALQTSSGDPRAAIETLQQALDAAEQRSDGTSAARCMFYIAQLTLDNPQHQPSDRPGPEKLLEQARVIFEKTGDRHSLTLLLLEQARFHKQNMDYTRAKDAASEAHALAEKMQDPHLTAEANKMWKSLE